MIRRPLRCLALASLGACSAAPKDPCTLTFELFATLAPPPGDPGFGGYPMVSPELPGRHRAITDQSQGEYAILLYDAQGNFTDTLGAIGSGPGEYRAPILVLPYRRDSILILDRVNVRGTVLDSSLNVARSFAFAFPAVWGAALTDGSLALAHGIGAGHRVGRFGPEGESLGGEPWSFERALSAEERDPYLWVGAEPDGGWWTLSLNRRFEFRRYSPEDSILAAWEFPSELLQPYDKAVVASPKNPPQPGISSGFIDSRDRLWTFAAVADSQWAEGLGPVELIGGKEYWPTISADAKSDALVIVAEAGSGRILRTWRLDSLPGSVVEPGLLLSGIRDEDGWFHPELRRPIPNPACALD